MSTLNSKVVLVVNYAGGQDVAEQLVAEIKTQGGEAIAVYGKIDVLVNNAGIMITKLRQHH
ncbi:MAG TPA: hypothetical protein VNS58_13250 [Puia sp.]|nr:hypothetical protein [Puia sp.]